MLDKDEVKAAAGDRGKVVHIEEFVDAAEIDPVFFEKTYYVGSRDDEDAYRLLHEALRRTGRAGIGRFTFHDREYLVAVRAARRRARAAHAALPRRGRPREGPRRPKPAGASRASGRSRWPSGSSRRSREEFDPSDYEDTYREAVLDLIKRKAEGKEIDLAARRSPSRATTWRPRSRRASGQGA